MGIPCGRMVFLTDILGTVFPNAFSWKKMFVPWGPIDNKSALIQVMACAKPLLEPMMSKTSGIMWCYLATTN